MNTEKRISILDELRGACIILVVVYHMFYSMVMIYGFSSLDGVFSVMLVCEPVLPTVFIILSGISFQLSRNNVKRGFRLLIIALIISVLMWIVMPRQMIWFGIIHFLAAANLILGALKKYVDRIPAIAGAAVCAVLFLLTYNLQRGYLGFEGLFAVHLPEQMYCTDWTMILGFYSPGFYSSDYFPLIPWIFLFIIGTIAGRYVDRLPCSLRRTHCRPLAFIGRHTLIIYLVHQPLIVGVLELIKRFS